MALTAAGDGADVPPILQVGRQAQRGEKTSEVTQPLSS